MNETLAKVEAIYSLINQTKQMNVLMIYMVFIGKINFFYFSPWYLIDVL